MFFKLLLSYKNFFPYKLINSKFDIFNNNSFLKLNIFRYIKIFNIKKNKILKKNHVLIKLKLFFKYFFYNKIIKLFYKLSFRIYNFFFKYTVINFFLSFYQEKKLLNFYLKKKINFKYIPKTSNFINYFINSKFIKFFFYKIIPFEKNIYILKPKLKINSSFYTLNYKIFFFISAGFGGYKKKFRRYTYRTKKIIESFKKKYIPIYFRCKMDFFYLIINGITTTFYKYFKLIRIFFIKKYHKSILSTHRKLIKSYKTLKKYSFKIYNKEQKRYKFNQWLKKYNLKNLISKKKKIQQDLSLNYKINKEKKIKKKNYYQLLFFFNYIIFYKKLYNYFFIEIIFLFLFKLFFLNKTVSNIISFIYNNNFWQFFYLKNKFFIKYNSKNKFHFKKSNLIDINLFRYIPKIKYNNIIRNLKNNKINPIIMKIKKTYRKNKISKYNTVIRKNIFKFYKINTINIKDINYKKKIKLMKIWIKNKNKQIYTKIKKNKLKHFYLQKYLDYKRSNPSIKINFTKYIKSIGLNLKSLKKKYIYISVKEFINNSTFFKHILLRNYYRNKKRFNHYVKQIPILISIIDKTSYPFNGCKRVKRY